eukprot:TRINITY_DN1536_c0_g1_i2.p1 TRINITY_DN1536_c0_g1~~TRINITY_DN1536_c0_g1_i2.p1  ORF type:complete len:377 (+),score=129.18 TRINITY_DN1536_c0_g1_i2:51-1181(+)
MGLLEKVKEIEFEISRTQYNKATEKHIGSLKAKLAKLRTQMLEPPAKGAGEGGFDVAKYGNARIALIGFPSVGKSTFLSSVTSTQSLVAAYEFTTLTCIPGNLTYKGTKLQILDLPGIIEGASEGRGKGRQVIAVAKNCDMILMVLDAQNAEKQKSALTIELEKVGIRLNKTPPEIKITKTKVGGVRLCSVKKLTYLDESIVKAIFAEYKLFNADVLVKGDYTIDDMVDAIEGNRKYLKCLYVYNKIDQVSIEDVNIISHIENSVAITCQLKLNLDYLIDQIWEKLDLTRIYTKKKGCQPDFEDPIVLTKGRNGLTVESVCNQVHKDFVKTFNYANIWGRSAKQQPQRCGLGHELEDEDVVQLVKKVYKIQKQIDQ